MHLALFDIDGTLIEGSSERLFWRYLVSHGYQGPRQLWHFAASLTRNSRGWSGRRANKSYLIGLRRADLDRLARDFVQLRLMRRAYPAVLAKLRWHRERGDTVVLLSGTLQPIAEALAHAWGVGHTCATLCVERNGVYCAEPPLRHPFGLAKLRYAVETAERLGLDLGAAYAYADSTHDADLLAAVGTPIAVMPDRRLRRTAELHDWQIMSTGTSRRSRTRVASGMARDTNN